MKTTHKLIIGFLILFIFTATFYFAQIAYNIWSISQKPVVMQLNMPDKTDMEEIPLKDALTVFPIGESKFYFEAKDKNGTLTIDSKEFTSLIENQEKIIGKSKFTVVIKATENAKYKDMVDLLDKLTFLKIKRYSITQISEAETKRINALP